MTDLNQPGIVLRSVDLLAGQREQLAAHFYGRLFGRYPHLEAYFQGQDTVWRERKFLSALRAIMMAANSPAAFDQQVGQLSGVHAEHEVNPDHFQLFVDVLLESLAYYGGPAWTPEVEATWRTVATQTAATLSAGARHASDDASEDEANPAA